MRGAKTSFSRTKIIGTLGPSSHNEATIDAMVQAGVDGVRLNFSHGTHDDHEKLLRWTRQASKKHNVPVAIIQDLQGPKLRLGDLDEPRSLKQGDNFKLSSNHQYENVIPTQVDLVKSAKIGDRIVFGDRELTGKVVYVHGSVVEVHVEQEGELRSHAGITLPDSRFAGDVLTAKDKEDVRFGIENEVEYIALSFVRSAQDVKDLRKILDQAECKARILAKIETRPALENIEEIVKAADGIIVARGDLSLQNGYETVPAVQNRVVMLALEHGKLTVVATQMLTSMISSETPTNAEVSDIANAVVSGTDAVLLSDETATGEHPLEAVEAMEKVIHYTESNMEFPEIHSTGKDLVDAVARSAVDLADRIEAAAIVARTRSGTTARTVARYRPKRPVIMLAHAPEAARSLALVYGAKPFYAYGQHLEDKNVLQVLAHEGYLKKHDQVVMVSGEQPEHSGGTDTIRVRAVE